MRVGWARHTFATEQVNRDRIGKDQLALAREVTDRQRKVPHRLYTPQRLVRDLRNMSRKNFEKHVKKELSEALHGHGI
jgi:hypothetical protein